MLPPLYLSRTSRARVWTQCLSPEAGGKAQLQVWGALTCQENFVGDTFEALSLGGMSGIEQRENNLFPSPPLPPAKTSVPAAACLCEAPTGAVLRPRAHQLHGMPPCSLAGYVSAAVSCKPDFVHRTVTFKAHGNKVICLFNQDINKQVTDKRRGEMEKSSLAEMTQVLSSRGRWGRQVSSSLPGLAAPSSKRQHWAATFPSPLQHLSSLEIRASERLVFPFKSYPKLPHFMTLLSKHVTSSCHNCNVHEHGSSNHVD